MLFITGCQTSNKLIELEGEGNHWKAKFTVTELNKTDNESKQPNYTIQPHIKCSDKSLILYKASYEVYVADQMILSGEMKSPEGKKEVEFSPVSDSYFAPKIGDEITVKIKWNETNEEEIVMNVE